MPPPRESNNIYIGWTFPNTQFGNVTVAKQVDGGYQLLCNQPPKNEECWKYNRVYASSVSGSCCYMMSGLYVG